MVDNVVLPAQVGVVAADEVADGTLGTVKVQYVKLMNGDLDSTVKYGDTVPLPVQGKQSALISGSITSAASVVTASAVSGYNIATVGVAGTYAGVAFVFEGSPDGTNWFGIQGQQTDNGAPNTTSTLPANTVRAWDVPVGAWTQFRVRATSWVSGTASILLMLQSMPTEPLPTTVPATFPTYTGSTNGIVSVPTTASTTTSIAYVFHGASVTKRYEIYRIELEVEGPTSASTAGQQTSLRIGRITAENGTPGGTAQGVGAVDQADNVSGGVFRTGATGAPTRAGSDFVTKQIQTVAQNVHHSFVWDAMCYDGGKPLVCRPSVAEGWEVRAVTNGTALGSAVTVSATFFWKEI